ncbi:MAG: hypothetical protein AVDCRST_MAG51-2885 [uncultured Ramlibacter sp.]|uniref:Flagellar biosynthesis protein n=1 Tax=uncultured Ramlibacter sp. TaxID=260755 RepID=A0A6J4QAT6_9BURK|nr:MAG: hypothetical protein AVDCRST_MAG51-2885 [uncultured Ramlibacter sp.]
MSIGRRVLSVALVAASLALGGCATSRSEVKIASPAAGPGETQAASNGRTVVIRSVKDERSFQQAPSNPSIPSLGFEGAGKASDEIKSRAIGRKRNAYGQALGDVLLQNGQTVEGLVRENLGTAFQRAGYRVVPEGSAGANPLIVDARIKQFWSWLQPGFWAMTLNANVETTLQLSGAANAVPVNVHVTESRQLATENVWVEIVEKALAQYRIETASKVAGPPF